MKQLCILTLVIMLMVCISSLALDNTTDTNESSITITYQDILPKVSLPVPTPTGTSNPTGRRIDQGGCVELGETIDIAGIGWYTGRISYYGRYYDAYAAGDNSTIEAVYKVDATKLTRFYVDPSFFKAHTGYWYTLYNDGLVSGNDRMFKVAEGACYTPEENATIVVGALSESQNMSRIRANLTSLPVMTEPNIDLILSKGSDTTIDAPYPYSRYWIFGRSNPDTLYDLPLANNITAVYSKEMLSKLEPAYYDVVFISPGNNGLIEENYNATTKSISSPFKRTGDTVVNGFAPSAAKDVLLEMIDKSYDDKFQVVNIDVQEPKILITKADQTSLTNNHTMFTISGYTNANQNTKVYVTIDGENPNTSYIRRTVWEGDVVNNGGQVAYRAWNISTLVDFNTMAPGMHTIVASNSEGAKATTSFYVRTELPEHYRPDSHLQYIDNSPFIPTPTPEVIVKTTVRIEQVVVTKEIPVTPSQESVNRATWEAWLGMLITACFVITMTAILIYLISVVVRIVLNRREG